MDVGVIFNRAQLKKKKLAATLFISFIHLGLSGKPNPVALGFLDAGLDVVTGCGD